MENRRYGFFAKFGDGGWNIVLQQNRSNEYYFSSDEDDFEKSYSILELFLQNGGNLYKYEVPLYEIWGKYTSGEDGQYIFELPDKPIEGLGEYLVKS